MRDRSVLDLPAAPPSRRDDQLLRRTDVTTLRLPKEEPAVSSLRLPTREGDGETIFVSHRAPGPGVATLGQEDLIALRDRWRALRSDRYLDWRDRSKAGELATLCERLIEYESGKKTFPEKTLNDWYRRIEEGLGTVMVRHLVRGLAAESGISRVTLSADRSTLSFTIDGKRLSIGLSPLLEPETLTTGDGTVRFARTPTFPEIRAAASVLPETLTSLKARYGSVPDDARYDPRTGLVSFTYNGERRLALRGAVFVPVEAPDEHRDARDNLARQARVRRNELTSATTQARDTIRRELTAGRFPDGGRHVPALEAALDRVRRGGNLEGIDLEALPPTVRRSFQKVLRAAQAVRDAETAVARAGGHRLVVAETVRVVGRGDKIFELHLERDRLVLVGRDSDDRADQVLTLARKGGSQVPLGLDVEAECRRLRSTGGGALPMSRLRQVGSLAAPRLTELLLDTKTDRPTRRAAASLLHRAGLTTVDVGGADRPLAAVMGELLTSASSGSRTETVRVLVSDPKAGAEAVRELLKDPKKLTPFARACLAEAAGVLNDRESIPALRVLLTDKDADVRHRAALALGRMGDRAALPILRSLLANPRSSLRVDAGMALLNYGRQEAELVATHALKVPELARRATEKLLGEKSPLIGVFLRRHIRDGVIAGLEKREGDALRVMERAALLGDRGALDDLLLVASDNSVRSSVRYVKMDDRVLSLKLTASECLARLERPADVAAAADALRRSVSGADRRHCVVGLREIVRSRRLGLELIDRFDPETRAEILRNREAAKPDGRPLAVLVYPKTDYNGAFTGHSAHVRALMKAGYRVMLYEAGSVQEATDALHDAAALGTKRQQRAALIFLAGHGTGTSMDFGFGSPEDRHRDMRLASDDPRSTRRKGERMGARLGSPYLLTAHVDVLKENLDSRVLADGGQVVLISCSTGAGRKWERPADPTHRDARVPNNIANLMREVFPHAAARGIWSPTVPTNLQQLLFDERGRLKEARYRSGPKSLYRAHVTPEPGDAGARPAETITV